MKTKFKAEAFSVIKLEELNYGDFFMLYNLEKKLIHSESLSVFVKCRIFNGESSNRCSYMDINTSYVYTTYSHQLVVQLFSDTDTLEFTRTRKD